MEQTPPILRSEPVVGYVHSRFHIDFLTPMDGSNGAPIANLHINQTTRDVLAGRTDAGPDPAILAMTPQERYALGVLVGALSALPGDIEWAAGLLDGAKIVTMGERSKFLDRNGLMLHVSNERG